MSTYRQLKQQIAELEKKASIAMKTEVRKVIDSIKRQIAEFGLTAADLGLEVARRAGAKAPRARKVALKPKYRDPVSGKTWNGHGKRPGWIVAAQAKDRLDDLLIDKPAAARPAKAAAKPAAKRATRKAVPAAKAAAKKPVKRAPAKAATPPAKKRAAPKTAARKPAPKKAAVQPEKAAPAAPAAPEAAPAAA